MGLWGEGMRLSVMKDGKYMVCPLFPPVLLADIANHSLHVSLQNSV